MAWRQAMFFYKLKLGCKDDESQHMRAVMAKEFHVRIY